MNKPKLILCVALLLKESRAFTSSQSLCRVSQQQQQQQHSLVRLHVDPPKNGNVVDADPVEMIKTPTSREKSRQNKPLTFVVNTVTSLWSVFILTFGAAYTCGLVLNLMGYGYEFSMDSGLRVESLDTMGMERQLAMPSSVAASNSFDLQAFFLKNPFLCASIATGVLILFESVLPSKKK